MRNKKAGKHFSNVLDFLIITILILSTSCKSYRNELIIDTSRLSLEHKSIIDEVIKGAEVVGFGESSHGVDAIHYLGSETFKYLAEVHGYRVFMLETMWAIDEVLTPFIDSDRTSLRSEESFYLNAFGSRQVKELLFYIRDFNREHPDDKIHVAGFQPEQPWSDLKMIIKYLDNNYLPEISETLDVLKDLPYVNGEINSDLESITYSWNQRKEKGYVFTEEEYSEILRIIHTLKKLMEDEVELLETRSGETEYLECKASLISLESYFKVHLRAIDNMLKGKDEYYSSTDFVDWIYNHGDSIKNEVFKLLSRTRYKDKKIYIWMHNWHAAKHSDLVKSTGNGAPVTALSVGTRLNMDLRDKYRVIATVVGAPDDQYERYGNHLEDILLQKYGRDTLLINLRNIEKKFESLNLENSKYSYVAQSDFTVLYDYLFPEQFDAVYFVPESEKMEN